MPNFKTVYNEKHKAAIQKDLGLANVMEIPKLEKITINMGLGESIAEFQADRVGSRAVEDYYRPNAGGDQG